MLTPSILLCALAAAASARLCQNLTVPISVTARNARFNVPIPMSDIDTINFSLRLSRQGANYTQESLIGYETIAGDYNIAATICHPDNGPAQVVQVLTHGIGFDRSYWDFPYANYNYSYVDRAVGAGYSVFFYDRPGIGKSTKGNAINEIQAALETEALYVLNSQLRRGDMECIKHLSFAKIINVGHSFGSVQAYGLALQYPDATDGLALTGFAQNGSFIAQFVLGGNYIPVDNTLLGHRFPQGYITPLAASSVQTQFFAPDAFDPWLLAAAYRKRQPVTPGELLTVGGLIGVPTRFNKPVLIITGEYDVPFCGGDCLATGDRAFPNVPAAAASRLLTAANPLQITIVPRAGHGLNLEFSHPFTYSTILGFFNRVGFQP